MKCAQSLLVSPNNNFLYIDSLLWPFPPFVHRKGRKRDRLHHTCSRSPFF